MFRFRDGLGLGVSPLFSGQLDQIRHRLHLVRSIRLFTEEARRDHKNKPEMVELPAERSEAATPDKLLFTGSREALGRGPLR